MSKGFTLIELVVVIAIIAVLSGVILFSVTQYISKGKDSSISANLAILVPAGESYYTANNNSYEGFCDPETNSVLKNIISQMPVNPNSDCYDLNSAGICCVQQESQAWYAFALEFTNTSLYYCVDSRGVKKEIPIDFGMGVVDTITHCP